MKHKKVCEFIFLLVIVHASANNISQLYNDLFDGSYNMNAPPKIPTDVSIEVQLEEIKDIDEVSETSTVRIRIHSWWYDDRLWWNKTEYDGLTTIQVPPHLAWKPDLALINSASDITITGSEASPITAVLSKSRDTVQMQWSPVGIVETKCHFDLTFYPYDNQTCDVQVGTLGSSQTFIKLKDTDCIKIGDAQTSTWSLEAMSRNVSEFQFDYTVVKKQHVLTCAYTLRRKSRFFFMNLVLPLFFLGFLTPFAFFIPNESGEKVSFVITLFLAFTVHETILIANVPVSSDKITYLQVYIEIQLAFTVFGLIVSIIQSRLFHNRKSRVTSDSESELPLPDGIKQTTYRDIFRARFNTFKSCNGTVDMLLFVFTLFGQLICSFTLYILVNNGTYFTDLFSNGQDHNITLF